MTGKQELKRKKRSLSSKQDDNSAMCSESKKDKQSRDLAMNYRENKKRKRSVSFKLEDESMVVDKQNESPALTPQPKQKKRLKSSKLDDELDEETIVARKENAGVVISEIEFKFLLSDRTTVLEGLEKFVHMAEAVTPEKPGSDIVAGYCRSSQTCSELFALIDPTSTQLKMNEMALVFRCLELILTRIRTDLFKFSSTGEAIVQKILAGHMSQVYNGLQEQHKSKTIKACLQLITAMVSLSERAKKAVLSRLNFAHISFPALFRRRNRKDTTDVRSCAVLLTLAFLVDSDLSTISTLVQQKLFIQLTVAGLKYDRRDLVLDVLATLLDKVVTFPGLSKTDKVKLFSEAVLKQLCELYDWQGPSGWVPSKKKHQRNEEVRVTPEGFGEDQETVASVCHEFLVELCCSHKNGLNFYDKTVGTGQRNHNQMLDHVVAWLIKKIDEPRKAELIIGILSACPDLIKSTLMSLCPSLTPRWSDKWRLLMSWLTNLYRKLPDIPPFLETQDYVKTDHVTVVSMAAVFCLPPSGVAAVLIQGLKHDDIRVRDQCARLIQVLAKRACAIHGQLTIHATSVRVGGASSSGDSFMDTFCARVLKTLPPTSQLFVCVEKTMQMMLEEQKVSPQEPQTGQVQPATLQVEPSMDLSRHASVLLQILGLYQTLTPSLLSERPKDLAKLIDMVDCLHSHHQGMATGDVEEKLVNVQQWLPQLYLLKLLSDTDARKISLGREGLMEKLLLSASKSNKFRSVTIGLVCKMLSTMEIFSEHVKELHMWLNIAMESTPDHNLKSNLVGTTPAPSTVKPVTFLARCLATLINNPSPYVDRVMEVAAETGKLSGDEGLNVGAASTDRAIDDILLMEDQELDRKLDQYQPHVSSLTSDPIHLPLSPLAVVALDNLQFGKTADNTEKDFVSRAFVHLLHSLPCPAILARIVAKSEAKLCAGVGEYLNYWSGGKLKTSVTQPLLPAKFGIFTSVLMCEHFGLKSSHCTIGELSNQMTAMTSREMLIGLKQVLLYVGDLLNTPKKTKKCEEMVATYLNLATSLSHHILEEQNQTSESDDSAWIKGLLNSSKNVTDDNEVLTGEDVSADEVDVFDVLFSQIVLSASESIVSDAFKCVLLNPVLRTWLFKASCGVPLGSDKKSPKRKDGIAHAGSISESVSQFVSGIIRKSRSSSWLKSEMDLVKEYAKLMVDELVSRKLPFKLEEICSQTLQSVSTLLDLPTLSRCVVRLLEVPLSSLVVKHQKDDELVCGASLGHETPTCRTLCELLKNLQFLIQGDPSFINNAQLASLVYPKKQELCSRPSHELDSCALKGCTQIKTTFSFEASSEQNVSAFAPLSELLPHCHNEQLREFAIFILTSLPDLIDVFQPQLFGELFKNPLTLPRDSLEERLFVSVIRNVKGCFQLYEEWLAKHAAMVIKRGKWFFISVYLEANANFSGGYTKTMEVLKQKASTRLKELDPASFSLSLSCWKLLSLAVQKNDIAFQELLAETVIAHVRHHKECHLLHFTVLEIATGFTSNGQTGQRSQTLVLELAVDHLTHLIEAGAAGTESLEEYILKMVMRLVTEKTSCEWKLLLPFWEQLTKSTLRHRLTDARTLRLVSNLAENILSVDTASPFSQSLFGQCVAHPNFHPVMTAAEHTEAKGEMVKLLHILGELQPSCYSQAELTPILTSAYSASLSLTDQRLLVMMEKCSQNLGKKFECPTLWGKSAVDHQAVSEVLGPSLHKQASTPAILDQLNSELMLESILNFPVRRFHSDSAVVDASEFKSRPDCYDPAFLLRLFVQILSPDKQVPLRVFVDKDCLSYLLIALSSHDLHYRLLAYQALNDFYLHTDGSRWHDKMEMTFVLDLLNASRVKDGQKLSFVVALFLTRTVKLLLYPADPMYVPIFRFLVARPEMDLGNVPEFYKLFFSAGVQYKHERNWMLSLLCDGMRETSDYWLYQKKFIFKILLSFYDSAISDPQSQELTLLLVKNACLEKSVAVDLVKNHGLMPWLVTAVSALDKRPEQTDILCDIIHSLWSSLSARKYLTQACPPAKKHLSSLESVPSYTEDVDNHSPVRTQIETNETQKNSGRSSRQETITDVDMQSDEDEDSFSENIMSHKDGGRDITSHSARSPLSSVPRSTVVEVGLVTKSLLWYLSNASVDGLLNVLRVLHGMTSSEAGNSQNSHSGGISIDIPDTALPKSSSQLQNLLNLSPIESCLLLQHVARAAQQAALADVAASLLRSKGVDIERTAKQTRAPGTRRNNSVFQQDNFDHSVPGETDLNDSTPKGQTKSKKQSDEPEPKVSKAAKNLHQKRIVTEDDKRLLFQLFHDIVRATKSLQFV